MRKQILLSAGYYDRIDLLRLHCLFLSSCRHIPNPQILLRAQIICLSINLTCYGTSYRSLVTLCIILLPWKVLWMNLKRVLEMDDHHAGCAITILFAGNLITPIPCISLSMLYTRRIQDNVVQQTASPTTRSSSSMMLFLNYFSRILTTTMASRPWQWLDAMTWH